MSAAKHTPEPWRLMENRPQIIEGGLDRHGRPLIVAIPMTGHYIEGHENAQRIVSCVNGCKGIPDPETTVPELVKQLKTLICRADSEYPSEEFEELTGEAQRLLAKIGGAEKYGLPQDGRSVKFVECNPVTLQPCEGGAK